MLTCQTRVPPNCRKPLVAAVRVKSFLRDRRCQKCCDPDGVVHQNFQMQHCQTKQSAALIDTHLLMLSYAQYLFFLSLQQLSPYYVALLNELALNNELSLIRDYLCHHTKCIVCRPKMTRNEWLLNHITIFQKTDKLLTHLSVHHDLIDLYC